MVCQKYVTCTGILFHITLKRAHPFPEWPPQESTKTLIKINLQKRYQKVVLEACIEKSLPKSWFFQKCAPRPPKWHPKSMKNKPWTTKGPPWGSKGLPEATQSSFRDPQDLKYHSRHLQYFKNDLVSEQPVSRSQAIIKLHAAISLRVGGRGRSP